MDEGTIKLPKVNVAKELLERLSNLPRNQTFAGCLYGLPAQDYPTAPVPYLVWTATGKERPEEPEIPRDEAKAFEMLTEALPCGIDPLGVFFLQEKNELSLNRIHELIDALPDAFLAAADPVVFTRCGDGELKVFIHNEGSLLPTDVDIIPGSEFSNQVQVVRVKGKLSINCPKAAPDLQNAFRHLIEKVSCPYGTFALSNSHKKVHLVHTWTQRCRNAGRTGWASTDGDLFSEEDVEECIITNVDSEDEVQTVRDLWKFVRINEDEEDGFGHGQAKKKKNIEEKEVLNFQLVMKMAGDACTSKTINCAPVIHYEKREFENVFIPLKIDAIGIVRKELPAKDLMEVLKGCVQRQVHEMGRSILSELNMRHMISLPETFHFKPDLLSHFCSIVYNKSGTCKQFAEFRRHIHRLLFLPVDRPHFRRLNAYPFEDDLPKDAKLINVHVGLKHSATGGKVALVHGRYNYHHYMQDQFDDDGWGCAYRSLQTIVSWYRYQGYCGSAIPTHLQIQKVLVDIGDKPASFIGSKQWIGSTEVGFVIEKVCGAQCKFLSVNSGAELAGCGRDLREHFKSNGTPIMIGGGVLAHTILGVDCNEDTGDIRWLVLDPHFTGTDYTNEGKPNLAIMQQKGWIGWKGPNFWKKDAFYNLCMPQRPVQW